MRTSSHTLERAGISLGSYVTDGVPLAIRHRAGYSLIIAVDRTASQQTGESSTFPFLRFCLLSVSKNLLLLLV